MSMVLGTGISVLICMLPDIQVKLFPVHCRIRLVSDIVYQHYR